MKRRFIAGAKCPKCTGADCIVMLTTADDEWIECIDCDYTEKRPTKEELEQMHAPADDVGVVQFKPR
ncbi:MAG: YheV family putative zinc ribbon protein [Acinetobacter sp.]|nr:YheV family putative zinc ribbon protein [Acinetobacter sp.]